MLLVPGSPGGPRASLPPSPVRVLQDRLSRAGYFLGRFIQERRVLWAIRQRNRVQVGCRELRSTKYISDGQCTSINPLKELVCAGECLPLPLLPNWIGGGYGTKYWSRRSSQEWRCVNDKTRTQRIQLQCQDGSIRTYKITVVTACKCKRYTRQHNESSHNFEGTSQAKPIQHHKERKRASKSSKHSTS
ncbi:PREDICTED: sclerostin domain-containing protein 1-like [Fulmarus glacialis]|uniref:sclerostin domain-containing protein 1-like n=1 Tax=Fulmarus glacialis TaxID=30455 RepID=UPI00051C8B27|nr:PREDICTED: sclerostin domain-containing protein 1-like [Fulmarus glacialis]